MLPPRHAHKPKRVRGAALKLPRAGAPAKRTGDADAGTAGVRPKARSLKSVLRVLGKD